MTYSEGRGRLVVYARSLGRCECCTRPASEWHHRLNRSQGGTWQPANGLHLCRWCHVWVTERRTHALALGMALSTGRDPAVVPAYVRPAQFGRGWWWLDDDGCWTWDQDRSEHPSPPDHVQAAITALRTARVLDGDRADFGRRLG